MHSPVVHLGLLGLASASPLASRTVSYPSQSSSQGFNLVVNVTDPSNDFSMPVHNSYVTSIHTGAGQALLGVDAKQGRIFYQNGTHLSHSAGQSTVLSDGGSPVFPSGLRLNPDKDHVGYTNASLDAGDRGTRGVSLFKSPVSYLVPERFLACNQSLSYYQGQHFVVIRQSVDPDHVPEECRPVRLLPECTKLNDLPANATASHEYALDSPCYDDVASIKWENHTPWIGDK